MNINCTLIIQVCNFFIAYVLLRVFFFRPTIHILEQEEREKKVLCNQLEEQKKFLQLQRELGQKQWNECREYFINKRPKNTIIHHEIVKNRSPRISSHITSNTAIEHCSIEIKTILEEKIRHVW